jgi:hypothetical protein
MSSYVVSKLTIDVLVQLAAYGPAEAQPGKWRTLIENPNEFGELLWSANYAEAGRPDEEPPLPTYEFRPLPFDITAAEGLKACSCYGYQMDNSWTDHPNRAMAEVNQIRSQLMRHTVGFEEAPWDWDDDDIPTRAVSRPPRRRHPSEQAEIQAEPKIIGAVESAFREAGFPLRPERQQGAVKGWDNPDPRDFVACWSFRVPTSGFPRLWVSAWTTEESARKDLAVQRRILETRMRSGALIAARTGNVVIAHDDRDVDPDLGLASALFALGKPDDYWAEADATILNKPARILASKVLLDLQSSGPGLTTARTTKQLQDLAKRITDPRTREQVLQIDPKRESVLLLIGVSNLDAASVHVTDLVDGPHALIRSSGTSTVIATLLVTPQLKVTPTQATVEDEGRKFWSVGGRRLPGT